MIAHAPETPGAAAYQVGSSAPLLVVGLDGATFRWLEPLALGGALPVLGRLLRSGVRAPLRSTLPPLTPPGWTTCLTGVSPARHGVWDFVRRVSPQRYDLLPTSGHDVRAPWIWEHFRAEDLERAWVLNLPFSFPARASAGLGQGGLVCGFDATDRARASWPKDLLGRIEQTLGKPYPFMYSAPARHIRKLFPNAGLAVALEEDPTEARTGLEAVVAESCAFTRTRLEAASRLLDADPYAFCFVHVFETDHLSHEAWEALDDPDHPDHALLLGYLKTLDLGLGHLIEAASRYGTPRVLLLSDHGFGPCRQRFLLNDWLVQEGFLVLKGSRAVRAGRMPLHAARWEDIDWTRTRAYAIQTGIYLNRRGTHPQGIVQTHEAPALLGDVIARLSQALDAERGAAAVEGDATGSALRLGFGPQALADLRGHTVVERTQTLAGSARSNDPRSNDARFDDSVVRLALAPDLIVHLETDVCAMGYGELQGEVLVSAAGLEGYHRMDGICVASGPGIRRGIVLPPVEMIDIAPTLLALLGQRPKPELPGLEGRVLWELLEPSAGMEAHSEPQEVAEALPVRLEHHAPGQATATGQTTATAAPEADFGLSLEDEALLRERLSALGYLG